MALFNFICPEHGSFGKLLVKGTSSHECPKCGAKSARKVAGGTVVVVETIDDGLMEKKIERPTNMDEMMAERIQNHNARQKGDEVL